MVNGAEQPTIEPEGLTSTEPVVEPTTNSGLEEVDPSLLAALDVLEDDRLWSGSEALVEEQDLHFFLEESVEAGDEILLAFLPAEDLDDSIPSDG